MRLALATVVSLAIVFTVAGRGKDTVEIPDSAKALKNPGERSEAALLAVRALWRTHCETCHGVTGRGDGPNARLHEQRKSVAPKDLSERELQESLSDGEIFWRLSNGLIDGDNVIMPAYDEKIPDADQRWQLVLFVRELGAAARR